MYNKSYRIGNILHSSCKLKTLLAFLENNNITTKYIINTHTHFDHILRNDKITEITKAKIIQHEKSTQKKGRSVVDHENISIGELNLEVLYTPGHSEDSICLIVNKESIITGDTLFVGNCGRVDLPGSNPEKMYDSLSKVANLDDDLMVYLCNIYSSK